MTANGIDVSSFQGKLDLTVNLDGLQFVIAKCTEGSNYVDLTYNHYQTQALSMGLHFGAYHFFHAERNDGLAEADWFVRHANLRSGMSVWLDYETYGPVPEVDLAQVALFAQTVYATTPVRQVGLYANLTGYQRLGQGLADVTTCLWLAQPTGVAETPDRPLAAYDLSWTLHQYETFAGIDRDYSRIDAEALTAFFTWPK